MTKLTAKKPGSSETLFLRPKCAKTPLLSHVFPKNCQGYNPRIPVNNGKQQKVKGQQKEWRQRRREGRGRKVVGRGEGRGRFIVRPMLWPLCGRKISPSSTVRLKLTAKYLCLYCLTLTAGYFYITNNLRDLLPKPFDHH